MFGDSVYLHDVHHDIIERVKQYAGLTIDVSNGQVVTSGFVVATEGYTKIVPDSEFFGESGKRIIAEYITRLHDVLIDNGNRLGVWHDKETNEVVFDVVESVYSRDEVIKLGVERNQKAVYDLTGETGDTLFITKSD
jgi:hypothetical protein